MQAIVVTKSVVATRGMGRKSTADPIISVSDQGGGGSAVQASDRDAFRGQLAMEPPGPQPAKARREGEFVVIAKAREKPGGGIAKTLAGVAAPRRCRGQGRGKRRDLRAIRSREFALEFLLTPFRAPAELAGGARAEFGSKHIFPAPAFLIRQSRPGEMEDFMNQDALEIAGRAQGLRIDQNETPGD